MAAIPIRALETFGHAVAPRRLGELDGDGSLGLGDGCDRPRRGGGAAGDLGAGAVLLPRMTVPKPDLLGHGAQHWPLPRRGAWGWLEAAVRDRLPVHRARRPAKADA